LILIKLLHLLRDSKKKKSVLLGLFRLLSVDRRLLRGRSKKLLKSKPKRNNRKLRNRPAKPKRPRRLLRSLIQSVRKPLWFLLSLRWSLT
jgi:hypothetical protein